MRRIVAGAVVGVMLGGSAWAQSQSDSVTVTSERQREAINNFVTRLTAPARLTGKLGRWDAGVCPSVIGIRPEAARFIVQRVRDTAARVGAPINPDAGCKSNIHIAFTTAPQLLVTNIRHKQPYLLGYADSEANKNALATVKFPIQAWYATQTRDVRGKTTFDSYRTTGFGNELYIPVPTLTGAGAPPTMVLPSASGAREVTGGRLADGARTVFYNVIVTADPGALLEQEMGTLGDHIAMLALAQTEPLQECGALPSILNLFTPGCAEPPTGMTVNDEGYLRGLYSMDAAAIIQAQRAQMIHRIGQTIEGR
jgi:hypothetical protein